MNKAMEELRESLSGSLKIATKDKEGTTDYAKSYYEGLELGFNHAIKMIDVFVERENLLK